MIDHPFLSVYLIKVLTLLLISVLFVWIISFIKAVVVIIIMLLNYIPVIEMHDYKQRKYHFPAAMTNHFLM